MATLHKRAQIRNAVAADLAGVAVDGVAGTVYKGRRFRLGRLQLPALLVYFDSEESEAIDMTGDSTKGRTQERKGGVVVQVVLRSEEELLDDALDAWSFAVEERLYQAAAGIMPGSALEPLVADWQVRETEIAASAEGGDLLGQVAMTFGADFPTHEGMPS